MRERNSPRFILIDFKVLALARLNWIENVCSFLRTCLPFGPVGLIQVYFNSEKHLLYEVYHLYNSTIFGTGRNLVEPLPTYSVASVRERTISTERTPLLIGEVSANFWRKRVSLCQRDGSLRPYSRFSRPYPYWSFSVGLLDPIYCCLTCWIRVLSLSFHSLCLRFNKDPIQEDNGYLCPKE
jgi:hypothetical protein